MQRAIVFSIVLLLPQNLTSAQTYSEIEALLADRNFSKAELLLKSRIATNGNDDSAHFYLGQIPVRSRNEKLYDEAIDHLKKCVDLKPSASDYHLWLGRAFGLKAQNAGIFSAMSYASDIKEAFVKAAELGPRSFIAHYDLIQFFLQAPGIAGGSTSKAKDVAGKYEKVDAELAKLLWTAIHLYEEEFDDAAARILSMKKPTDKAVLRTYRFLFGNVGNKLLEDKQPAKAQNIFQQYTALFPDNANGYHGLGRSLSEQNKWDDAIPLFVKAISLDKSVGSQYRLGLIYELKGDKQKAIKYFEEFLSVRQGRKDKTIDEVKEKLVALRSNE